MKRIFLHVRRRLSIRLGLLIVLIVTVAFFLLFGYLFYRGKRYIQHAAIDRATKLLDNTAERINGIMDATETVTNFLAQTTPRHLCPDSLLVFTRRAVEEHSFLTGMAISMEPYYFPEMGRYFSAYSLRYMCDEDEPPIDSITTVREGPFEYFDAVWYKASRTLGTSSWVDAYDDYNEGTLSSPDILTSYCCPMRNADGQFIGSITASLTLKWLSASVSDLKPYPNSSAIMIDRRGTYIVHPDTAKLYRETIFSDADPKIRHEIESLGKDMLAGHSGMVKTTVDGAPAYIFYRPLERTGWSIAIVCPESDIFARYNKLVYIVWFVVSIGLVLLMLFCYQTVRRAVLPIKQLDKAARRISNGHFDVSLFISSRQDSLSRLTNSFAHMQQSLANNVESLQHVNEELQSHNEELAEAYELKLETNRRKTAFIRNVYHEIRTPLNIISGFAQVLFASQHALPTEEVDDIIKRMRSSAKDISRLARELSEVSNTTKTTDTK